MTLTHEQARELIQKSLQAKLDAFESEAVTAHLANCAECAAYQAEMRAFDKRLAESLPERWPERRYTAAELDRKLVRLQTKLRREIMFNEFKSFARLAGAAAALIILIIGLAWLARGYAPRAVPGTGQTETPRPALTASPAGIQPTASPTSAATPTVDRAGRLTLEEAGQQVRNFYAKTETGIDSSEKFPLQEITTDEIWQRMHMQVFKVTGGVKQFETLALRGGTVEPVGVYWGGTGVDQMIVTDLDADGQPDLLFTCIIDAGLNRSTIGFYSTAMSYVAVDYSYQGGLSLAKQDDQTVRLIGTPDGKTEAQELGLVRWINKQLVLAPDTTPMLTYTSPRFGVSFAIPEGWQAQQPAGDQERYSGADGSFTLSMLKQGAARQDLSRVCEWEANSKPAQYGDMPEIQLASSDVASNHEKCLILTSANGPDARAAVLFQPDWNSVALLEVSPARFPVVAASMQFAQQLPDLPQVAINMTPQVPDPPAKLQTSDLGSLALSEYPVVSASQDTPSHFEFSSRIPENLFPRRTEWLDASQDEGVQRANQQLQPFGYRIVFRKDSSDARFDLYRGSEKIRTMRMFYPVLSYQDESGKGDFAMVFEDAESKTWLARKDGVTPWDMMINRFTHPILIAGGGLVTAERDPANTNGLNDRVFVKMDGQTVFTYALAPSPVREAVKTLGVWNGGWVLEVNGTLIVNGAIYNLKDFPADEIFNWTMLDGKPFFFFTREGKTGAWYDGKELPVEYDDIIHDQCCEAGGFNVTNSPDTLWFYAKKNGTWYWVQLGTK